MATPEYIYDIDDSPTEMQNEMSDLIKQMAAQKKATQDFELGLMREDLAKKESRRESDRLYERAKQDSLDAEGRRTAESDRLRRLAQKDRDEDREYRLKERQAIERSALIEAYLKMDGDMDEILKILEPQLFPKLLPKLLPQKPIPQAGTRRVICGQCPRRRALLPLQHLGAASPHRKTLQLTLQLLPPPIPPPHLARHKSPPLRLQWLRQLRQLQRLRLYPLAFLRHQQLR